MEGDEKALEESKKAGKKEDLIGCLTLLVVAVIIIVIVRGCAGCGDSNNREEETASNSTQPAISTNIDGLGVSRDRIIAAFAEKGFAFAGEEASPVNGQLRWLGKSADGLSVLELIGPKDNLNSAFVAFGVPAKDSVAAATGMGYMLVLLGQIFPDWDGRNDWVVSTINQVLAGKETVSTNKDSKYIEFTMFKDMGMYGLSVKSHLD